MENDLERWLNFAVEVEDKFAVINMATFSDTYKSGLFALLYELRHEASLIEKASPIEKQECYFRINYLAKKTKDNGIFLLKLSMRPLERRAQDPAREEGLADI